MREPTPPGTDVPPLGAKRPRRAPAPEERQRDADRSRAQLLAAALDEFAARGFAGARVHEIAAKAGLNKQLITYYFGGKEGLYHALIQRWLQQEATLADPERTLEDLLVAYLQACFDDPRMTRLLLWIGLTDSAAPHERPPSDPNEREDLSDLQRRQAQGEIAADLDPGLFQLAMMGAIVAPIAMPQVVRRITGLSPDAPKFQAHYSEQLRRIVRHLTGNTTP
jgi:TetR/AcrR family transcriptional regulator